MKKSVKYLIIPALALLCTALRPLPLQAQESKNILTTVAPSLSTWLGAAETDKQIILPATGAYQTVTISTNLNVSVLGHPAWCKVSQAQRGAILLQAEDNSNQEVRTDSIVLKAKDNKRLALAVSQLGTGTAAVCEKPQIILYGDSLSFNLKILGNTAFTLILPEWLSQTNAENDVYVFRASELTTASSRQDTIKVQDLQGNTRLSVPISQMYDCSCWFLKPCFAVISDIHYGDNTSDGYKIRMPRVFNTLGSHIPAIRNLFVVGDLANTGTLDEYKEIKAHFYNSYYLNPNIRTTFMLGNHDNFNYCGQAFFTQTLEQPLNQYQVIQGYPFISISSTSRDYNGANCFNAEAMDFLANALADANARFPEKPIFVFQHQLPLNTVIGSHADDDEGYAWGLDELFNKYPQVIDFCAHTHFSISDPRQIWQGRYTVVNDGGEKFNHMAHYTENGTKDFPQYWNVGAENYEAITEGLVVHINERNAVVIERWNTALNQKYSPDWTIEPPFDGTKFTYTENNGGKSPWWKSGSRISITDETTTSCNITFPQAQDDSEVFRYVISITDSQGKNITNPINQSSLITRAGKCPEGITVSCNNLPAKTQLTCTILAYDAYDNASEQLSATFSLNEN